MSERALRRVRFGGFVLAVSVSVATLPRRAHAEEGSSTTKSEAPVLRPPEPLLTRVQTGGLVLFGVSYGLVLGIPAMNGFSEGREWFALPVAGPIVAATRGAVDYPWAIVLDEVGQVGGLTLLVAGDSVSWGSTASVSRCRGGGVCVGARGVF